MSSKPSFPNSPRKRARPHASVGLLLSLLTVAGLNACLTQDKIEEPVKTEQGLVLTINSDYKTGSYSAFGVDSDFNNQDIEPIHSDAVVRYLGGDDIFILNRLGRDNLEIVDRHNLKTVLQVTFPSLSNPYDIALKDSLLYVGFFGSYSKIGIYKQSDGSKAGEIDLAAYADTSDHFPEVTALTFVGNDLYTLIANMNSKTYEFQQAKLAKINVTTKEVKVIDLPFGNPVSLTYDKDSGKLFVPCRGTYFTSDFSALMLDGGIVGVRLSDFKVSDTLATEVSLHGSLGSAHLDDGRLIMDLSTDADEKLSAISLKDGKMEEWASFKKYKMGGMGIDAKTGTLYVGDRDQGLRFFDVKTGVEKSGSKVKMSALPITDLAVIR
jgi:hypothetical protein